MKKEWTYGIDGDLEHPDWRHTIDGDYLPKAARITVDGEWVMPNGQKLARTKEERIKQFLD